MCWTHTHTHTRTLSLAAAQILPSPLKETNIRQAKIVERATASWRVTQTDDQILLLLLSLLLCISERDFFACLLVSLGLLLPCATHSLEMALNYQHLGINLFFSLLLLTSSLSALLLLVFFASSPFQTQPPSPCILLSLLQLISETLFALQFLFYHHPGLFACLSLRV